MAMGTVRIFYASFDRLDHEDALVHGYKRISAKSQSPI